MNKILILSKMAKYYFRDLNKLWNINEKQLQRYQDKLFRKIVNYAYTVPLYHKKYKEKRIHPSDIRGIKDIKKLPYITKDDIRYNYPVGVLPKNYDKTKDFLLSTSGSTGKPLFLYVDLVSSLKNLILSSRAIKAYNGDWRKSKIMAILDISQGSIENATFRNKGTSLLNKFFSLNNIKYIDISKKPEIIIEELNEFNPDFFGSEPTMLLKLATLKNQGKGKNINPKYIWSASAMLDEYTREYVEKAFDAKVFDIYATTEAGTIAFECRKCNCYHVNSDFVYLEVLDDEENNKSGVAVFTRLYGKGTPIIRYTGSDDIIELTETKNRCGIVSQNIKKILGRTTDLIILHDGKKISPFVLTRIPALIMKKYNTYKIKQFQIIQQDMNLIEVLVVIDEKLRNIGIPVEKLFSELKENFLKEVGQKMKIEIHEVEEIEKDKKTDKLRVVISKVKIN